jgi:hypothetical protein
VTVCTGAGNYENSSGVFVTLAEGWNGTKWEVQATPNPEGAKLSSLVGVSCASSTACAAGGYYENSSAVDVTLAEGWSGSKWEIQSTPNPEGAKASFLDDVSCVSSTACTATGSYKNSSGVEVTLAEGWNGSKWEIQSTPNPEGAKGSVLRGVSCASSTACTGVGWYTNSSGALVTLAEGWNGTKWEVESTPNPAGSKGSYLRSISCVSSTACTAVGTYTNSSGVEVTLAEGWNGSKWEIQATPSPEGVKASYLRGVSCVSSTVCTATGYSWSGGSQVYVPLVETWNGTKWEIQSTPSPEGAKSTDLEGVSCVSWTACTAAGDYENSSGVNVTLAESY